MVTDHERPTAAAFSAAFSAARFPRRKSMRDEHVFAFEDINPQAPTHVLVIPKKHFAGLKEAQADDAEVIGRCHLAAAEIARQRNIEQRIPHRAERGSRGGPVSFSSPRTSVGRARPELASGIGAVLSSQFCLACPWIAQGRYCTVGFSSSGAP
jgi:hypothetical protein